MGYWLAGGWASVAKRICARFGANLSQKHWQINPSQHTRKGTCRAPMASPIHLRCCASLELSMWRSRTAAPRGRPLHRSLRGSAPPAGAKRRGHGSARRTPQPLFPMPGRASPALQLDLQRPTKTVLWSGRRTGCVRAVGFAERGRSCLVHLCAVRPILQTLLLVTSWDCRLGQPR